MIDRMLPRGTWSLVSVVAELRRLHAEGEIINRANLMDGGYSVVVSAAERYCGSFGRAVKLAGITYTPARPSWDAKRVIVEIRRLHAKGVELSCEQLRSAGHGGLVAAATKHHGNWRSAIAKANVPTYKRGRWKTWSAIRTKLRSLHATRVKMSISSLGALGFADLAEAARIHAGSWNKALALAGIPLVMKYERWTRDEVLTQLRRVHASGLPLSTNVLIARGHRKLVKAATRHFKSWKLACYTAVPGYQPLAKRWTIALVIRRIERRHREGKSIRSTVVQQEDPPLTAAARRLGISWRDACRRATVPARAYEPLEPAPTRRRWTRALIIAHLRTAAADKVPLVINSFPRSFLGAVVYRWGSWPAAIASARLTRQYKRDLAAAHANRLGGAFVRARKPTRARRR